MKRLIYILKEELKMMKRFLDCSELSMQEFTKVQAGYNDFLNNRCDNYFGYVDKKTLKYLNRVFDYVDGRSWISGALIGGLSVAAYVWCKNQTKEHNEKTSEEE